MKLFIFLTNHINFRTLVFSITYLFCISPSMDLIAQSCGYAFQKEITIDHTKVSGTGVLTDFPFLYSVTDPDLRLVSSSGHVQNANGYDIIFVTEAGEAIPHQIEHYVPATGQYVAWLKLPALYGNTDTRISMYYGNAAVTSDPSSTGVWDSDYQAVWHLHDDLNDAAALGNDGTNSGSTDASAKIADGQSFDGVDDYLLRTDATLNGNIPSISSGSPDEFTLSGWIYIDAINARRPLLSKQMEGAGTDRGFVFMFEADNRLKAELFKNNVSGDRTEVYSTATASINTWYYIVCTYRFVTDGTSEVRLYINGVNDGSTNTSIGPIVANSRDLNIGRYFWNGGTNYHHDGLIDEVRISDVVRSADWIATEYENQNDPSAFFITGSEVGGSFTPIIPTCGYSYRKVLTIDNSLVSGSTAHTNFPLLVSLTDTDLRTTTNGGHVENVNGYDIIFTDDNMNPLDHQIEKYVATTGEYVAWVKIPSLPTSSDLDINMFYGNVVSGANPSTTCVWSDYEAVWHLHDDFLDASGNSFHGTNNGSADNTSSKIADGQTFDGTDFIELSSFTNMNTDFTITGWINTTDNTQAGQRIFCDDETNTGGYAFSLGDGGTGRLRFYSRSMSSVILDGPNNSISNNTWYYVSAVADRTGTDRRIFVNGSQVAANTNDTGTWGTDAGDASIGGETASGETANRFEGMLDEIRIANAVRSSDWLTTEYNNQNNPSAFYSVGAEIALNITSAQNGDWDQTATWTGGVVPGLGANVTIQHNVDLDDRDEYICNLVISNANNNPSAFEVQSGHTLEIKEDVLLDGSDNTNSEDITLRITDNNSKLIINGNMYLNHTGGDDVFVDLEDTDDSLIVMGSFILNHDGGDEIEIRNDDASSVIYIQGDLVANMNSGAGDLIQFDLNDGDMIVNGALIVSRFNDFGDLFFDLDNGNLSADSIYLSSSGGGGNDEIIINIDGTSQFISQNGMTLVMGGGDDHTIFINVNNGSTGQLTVNGDFLVEKSGGDDLNITIDDDNSLFHITGDFTLNSTGAEQITLELDNNATFDVDGNLYWNHSNGQVEEIFLQGGADIPLFNVDGDFIVSLTGGNDDFILDLDGGALVVNNDFLITKNDNTGTVVDFDLDDGTLSVTDSLYILHQGDDDVTVDLDGASTINAGNFIVVLSGVSTAEEILIDIDNSSIINVTGDLFCQLNTGNDFEFHLGENTVSTSQLIVGGNFTLDHNGAVGADDIQLIINDNCVVTVGGIFTMETDGSGGGPGNFYTRLNDNARLTVASDIVMDNLTGNGYLEIEMNTSSLLQIGGDIVRNAAPNDFGLIESNSNLVTIEYNGNVAQVFADDDGAGTDGIQYQNVIINNSFVTEPQIIMAAPVTIPESITFTDGVLQTTSVNLLTLSDDAVSGVGNAGSYVSGPMRKVGNDPFVFPLGKNGRWARLEISNLQNGPAATDVFTAEYFDVMFSESFFDTSSYAGDPGGMYNTSIVEYWDLSRDNGSAEPQVTLYWSDNATSYIDDTADLVVAHYIGGNTWLNEGGAASGLLTSGAVHSTTNVSSFSEFTFGSTSSSANPLPVELLYFNAELVNDVVMLNWATLSEINNEFFTIERSADAKKFEPLIIVPGAGNSGRKLEYSSTDKSPLDGISYYRLKQTDFNGKYSYSAIRVISTENKPNELLLFPNPSDLGSIFFSKSVTGSIFNNLGLQIAELNNQNALDCRNLPSGYYYFRNSDGLVYPFIIR